MIRSTGIFLPSAAVVVLIWCIGVSSAAPASSDDYNPSDVNWRNFKANFKKNYVTVSDDNSRRAIWKGNLDLIKRHNLEEAQTGKHGYTLKVNQFADMSDVEFKRTLGFKSIPTRSKRQTYSFYISNSTLQPSLPASVNWTAKGLVNPIQDQGYCGSCYAFSANGALEGQYFKKYNKSAILSEQNLVDCSMPQKNLGCSGGNMVYAYQYINQSKGIDSTTTYPYTAQTGTCRYNESAKVSVNLTSYQYIKTYSESDLQQAVALVGPIAAAIDAGQPTFRSYSSGVYSEQNCTTSLNHGILVVGYGTYNNTAYWLIKNSWGTSWGMQGYMMLARNAGNKCGIASFALFPNLS